MKTLVKKTANTVKAVRYIAFSSDKDKMSWCSFHMHLMVATLLKSVPLLNHISFETKFVQQRFPSFSPQIDASLKFIRIQELYRLQYIICFMKTQWFFDFDNSLGAELLFEVDKGNLEVLSQEKLLLCCCQMVKDNNNGVLKQKNDNKKNTYTYFIQTQMLLVT